MTPAEIKDKVQAAYARAMEDRSSFSTRYSDINRLFRDVKIYGSDAGKDFIATNLDKIIKEMVEAANCKCAYLEVHIYGCGHAALKAMAETIQQLTSLPVERQSHGLKVSWANTTPRLL